MNTKYTSDGKKVAVVGQLNAKETIVQEIFIVNDNEIPSGENFVVKSLHDKPSISWKEKKIKEMQDQYSAEKFRNENELKVLRARHKTETSYLSGSIKASIAIQKNIEAEPFDMLVKFLKGEITHAVIVGYDGYEIKAIEDALRYNDDYSSNLKLLTLYGSHPDKFSWYVNRYSDGSGSDCELLPCCSAADGIRIIRDNVIERLKKRAATKGMIEAKEKYNLDVPSKTQIEEYYANQITSAKKTIKRDESALKTRKEQLFELESKIDRQKS